MGFLNFLISWIKLVFNKIFESFVEVVNGILYEDGIKEKNLESFLTELGVSDLLKYRDYYKEDDQECGIYLMSDFSKTIIMRIIPPSYVSSKTEDRISELFSSIDTDNTTVQFTTFASRNIEEHLRKFEEYHTGKNLKIDNPKMLENIIYKRISELRRWTNESMAKGIDFRIKDFHNLLSINFPAGTEDKVIYKKYSEIMQTIDLFHPQNYSADNLLTIISEMFYFEKNPKYWESKYDDKMELNHQMVSGGVEFTTKKDFKGFKSNDKTFYRVLTVKNFPRTLSLFDYNNAFFDKMGQSSRIPISSSFMLSLTIHFDNVKKRKEKVLSKLNHDIAELSKLRPIDMKKRPDLRERLKETESSIYLLREENETPIKGMLTLTIMDSSESKLDEQVSAIKQNLSDLGLEMVEEYSNNIAFMTWIYSLPGMFSKAVEENSKRFRILFKSNFASMAPIIGDSLGAGDYNLLTIGRTGQIQRWDPFARGAAENPNIIKAGGSGSGKSFSESEFQASCVSAGYLVRAIDAGESYKTLCNTVGGQYIEFTEDTNLSLNFFTKALTKIDSSGELVLHDDEVVSITTAIGLMGGVNLANEFRLSGDVVNITKVGVFTETIMKSVNLAFKRAKFSATLEDVRDIIIEFSKKYKSEGRNVSEDLLNFASSIYRFADSNGPYSKFFNPPNNIDFHKSYVVIETQTLLNAGEDLFVVVVAILSNQIKNEFFDIKNIEQKKVLIIDEAKPILDNPISLALLIQIYRKIRKYNGLANTITQSINDFFASGDVQVLQEIAGWKWFLKQNDGVISQAYESKRLSINRFEKRLLESVSNNPPNYNEYYLSSQKVSMLSRLKVDSLTYWAYTTDGLDKGKISQISEKYNISESQARIAMSHISEGQTIESSIEMAKKNQIVVMDDFQIIEICKKIINRAIKNPNIIGISSLGVYSKKDGSVLFHELFAEINNDDGIKNSDIYSRRKMFSSSIMDEFDVVILKKLLSFAKERNGNYSINLSVESLLNQNIKKIIYDYSQDKNFSQRIVFEIPLGNIDFSQDEQINSSIVELKEYGFKIVNDNLKNEERLLNILSYGVDYVKITPDIYGDSKKSLDSEITLLSMKRISEKRNIIIIGTLVSSEEIQKSLESHSYIEYEQGFYISPKKKEI